MTPLTPAAVTALAQQAAESPAHLDPVLVQQVCQEWEEQREALTLQGMGKQLTLLQQQRDAALAERDEARERHETLSHHYRSLTASVSEAEQALEDAGMPEGQRFSVSVLAIVAQLTEARRVLRECRVALEGVVRVADRKTTEFDAARSAIAAVLAQEEK